MENQTQQLQHQQAGRAPSSYPETAVASVKDASGQKPTKPQRDSLAEPTKQSSLPLPQLDTRLDADTHREFFGTPMTVEASPMATNNVGPSHNEQNGQVASFRQEPSSGPGNAINGIIYQVVMDNVNAAISAQVAATVTSISAPTHATHGSNLETSSGNMDSGSTTYHIEADVRVTQTTASQSSAPAQRIVSVAGSPVQPQSTGDSTAHNSDVLASAPTAPAPQVQTQPLMPPPAAPASMLANLKESWRAIPDKRLTDPSIVGHLLPAIVILFRLGKAKQSEMIGQFAVDLIGEELWRQELPEYLNAPSRKDDEANLQHLLVGAIRIIRMTDSDAERAGYLDGLCAALE